MSIHYQRPLIEKANSPVAETRETHPAYAQIGANRVSGRTFLYGSDFEHQNYVTVSIRGSELMRGLSNDWPFGRQEYIEVSLSEAQWASFVSTMNSGMGTQCTLRHRDGTMIPQIPAPASRHEQFEREANETIQEAMDHLKALRAKIEAASLSAKAKKDLTDTLHRAEMNLNSNLGFVAEQFGEHMEKTTEKAKVEINAYVQATIHRAGIAHLQESAPFRMIEGEPK